ncbi:Clavaminate synthase-like protein [Aureobasidium sp. EXF-12298]|nr:Clavaminate synthase-like protein [Aureobasidium sp. EXF-12298]KAI4758617.1 Clavaminate synthase-like protein [Aureobasidium sp. EXF-12344]KAI4775839.1 Clavaminate synthase-like protein [Aureobasidium sp. EXF-3400]
MAGPDALSLAEDIRHALTSLSPKDPIHECGSAPLHIIQQRPEDVLALAHQKLHTWKFDSVPLCWRRLYEEASLYQAIAILNDHGVRGQKRKRHASPSPEHDFITLLVHLLDMAIILTGAPRHRQLILNIAKTFPVAQIPQSQNDTFTRVERLDFLQFQRHLDTKTTPIVIKGVIDDWPAMIAPDRCWSDPSYLLKATLGGRRLVPVELGRSYTDDDWSQRIMTFAEYMKSHLLQLKQEQTGYLAQHDLFSQVPCLSADTNTPDYCYTNPPPARSLSSTVEVETLDEPLRNAWLGPAGTISPLHTDPYHNILCQVVGYKYVRLYAPTETAKLYPRGIDETGVNMENTSHVDISLAKRLFTLNEQDRADEEKQQFEAQFPLFRDAECIEGVLGPGECLYIPVGWWHFVESLSTSFSMSFWWN